MSLYTKYRPQDFENLEGQDFIKNTLKAAIEKEKTVGAYLFCGPRGTGKTSTARIFSKTINCLNIQNGNPCLVCEICRDFQEDSLIDIIEIDAASHTGVDNIREIIEKAQFQPTKTKYKVYIIDEVHMLSKGAFNALLKILEEPPKHVKFILATTETHKVPETIISRCQRYDFKRIDDQSIKDRLNFIAKEENINIDEKSLNYIISSSNGGLRNAISLFEQLIQDSEIIYKNIIDKLGIVDNDKLQDFLDKLLNKDISLLNNFDTLIESGKNIKLFIRELLLLTKNQAIEEVKKGKSIHNYIFILETLEKAYIDTKNSLDENTTFLIALLKILEGYIQAPPGNNTIKKVAKKSYNSSIDHESSVTELTNEVITKPNKNIAPTNDTISIDTINDIFEGETEAQNNKKADNDNLENQSEIIKEFDPINFIAEVKNHGAKGALTMSLRASKLQLSNTTLSIIPNTPIARKTIENNDNRVLLKEVLKKLGYDDTQIVIQ